MRMVVVVAWWAVQNRQIDVISAVQTMSMPLLSAICVSVCSTWWRLSDEERTTMMMMRTVTEEQHCPTTFDFPPRLAAHLNLLDTQQVHSWARMDYSCCWLGCLLMLRKKATEVLFGVCWHQHCNYLLLGRQTLSLCLSLRHDGTLVVVEGSFLTLQQLVPDFNWQNCPNLSLHCSEDSPRLPSTFRVCVISSRTTGVLLMVCAGGGGEGGGGCNLIVHFRESSSME